MDRQEPNYIAELFETFTLTQMECYMFTLLNEYLRGSSRDAPKVAADLHTFTNHLTKFLQQEAAKR